MRPPPAASPARVTVNKRREWYGPRSGYGHPKKALWVLLAEIALTVSLRAAARDVGLMSTFCATLCVELKRRHTCIRREFIVAAARFATDPTQVSSLAK